MFNWKKWTAFAVAVIFGFGVGFLFAARSFRYELQVDYASGSLRNAMYVGTFMVRTEPHHASHFGALSLPKGRAASTGSPKWTIAQCFYGDFRVSVSRSPTVELLANEIIGIDPVLKTVPAPKAAELKQSFLHKLNSEGEESASAFLRNASVELFDDMNAFVNVRQ